MQNLDKNHMTDNRKCNQGIIFSKIGTSYSAAVRAATAAAAWAKSSPEEA